jgi:hypothetical protein
MKTDVHATPAPIPVGPLDLFAMLEQAYRRHNLCRACTFTLPERVSRRGDGAWMVIPSATCTEKCRDLLDDLVARYQGTYRLKEA